MGQFRYAKQIREERHVMKVVLDEPSDEEVAVSAT